MKTTINLFKTQKAMFAKVTLQSVLFNRVKTPIYIPIHSSH